MTTRVLLVRHGRTTWNDEGRVQGWAPVPLDEVGREQVEALATYLGEMYAVDHVVSSDLRRAMETTRAVGRVFPGAPTTVDERWRERNFGILQGLERAALFEGYPEFALSEVGALAVEGRPEGGESLLDVRDRILGAWDLLGDEHAAQTVLVITHSGPIRVVLAALLGRDLLEAIVERRLDNCSVSEVVRRDDRADGPSRSRDGASIGDRTTLSDAEWDVVAENDTHFLP